MRKDVSDESYKEADGAIMKNLIIFLSIYIQKIAIIFLSYIHYCVISIYNHNKYKIKNNGKSSCLFHMISKTYSSQVVVTCVCLYQLTSVYRVQILHDNDDSLRIGYYDHFGSFCVTNAFLIYFNRREGRVYVVTL